MKNICFFFFLLLSRCISGRYVVLFGFGVLQRIIYFGKRAFLWCWFVKSFTEFIEWIGGENGGNYCLGNKKGQNI